MHHQTHGTSVNQIRRKLVSTKTQTANSASAHDCMVPCNNLHLLHVSGFLSAYTLSDTESTLKSHEGEGALLGVTHQKQQDAEDSPVGGPQDKLSM